MNQNQNKRSVTNIGSASLLVIFLTLCLSSFSILSLASASSDYAFSQRLAENKSQYYDASSKAQQIAAEIDDRMEQTFTASKTAGNASGNTSGNTSGETSLTVYENNLADTLNGVKIADTDITVERSEEQMIVSYQVPLDESQALSVRLLVLNPAADGAYYRTDRWQVVSTAEWNGDTSLDLMPIIQ